MLGLPDETTREQRREKGYQQRARHGNRRAAALLAASLLRTRPLRAPPDPAGSPEHGVGRLREHDDVQARRRRRAAPTDSHIGARRRPCVLPRGRAARAAIVPPYAHFAPATNFLDGVGTAQRLPRAEPDARDGIQNILQMGLTG